MLRAHKLLLLSLSAAQLIEKRKLPTIYVLRDRHCQAFAIFIVSLILSNDILCI